MISNRNLCAAMTNATTKLRFCATPKSDILCNTDVQHGSPPFLQSEILTFLQQNFFVAKNAEISDCKNGRFPCCTSVLHKIYDFGVAQNLNFVVALVIAAHKFLLSFSIKKPYIIIYNDLSLLLSVSSFTLMQAELK